MSYGERLTLALKLSGVGRKALGIELGISVQAIGMVARGESNAFTAENSARAARFLRVDGHWLATGEGEARPASEKWPFLGFSPFEYYSLDESLRNEIEDRLTGAVLRMKRERSGELPDPQERAA